MYRHHVFCVNLPDSLSQKVNQINASLGITVQSIDLNNYKENYGEAEDLNSLLDENEYPKWIWLYGVEALKDTCFSGWIRYRLTVRVIENLRVVFVTDSQQSYRDVFCDHRVPFYQTTILFRTDTNN